MLEQLVEEITHRDCEDVTLNGTMLLRKLLGAIPIEAEIKGSITFDGVTKYFVTFSYRLGQGIYQRPIKEGAVEMELGFANYSILKKIIGD